MRRITLEVVVLLCFMGLSPIGCGEDTDLPADAASTDTNTTDTGATETDSTDADTSDTGSTATDPTDADPSGDTPTDRCSMIEASIGDAGFGDSVDVRCEDDVAYLISSTYPSHDVMNGITGTNEQIPVPAAGLESPVPLNPVMASAVTTRDSSLGIAVNGVPIYDYTAGGEIEMDADGNSAYDANLDTTLIGQLDHCGGHSGRGDDYHYHKEPSCMLAAMPNAGNNPILGWAYDGFPIYGKANPDGSAIGPSDLDPCNGQADETFGYRYHTSDTQPYIIKCLKGEVDEASLPRVSPFRDGGRPIAVSGLSYTTTANSDGTETRRLSYTYQSADYYIEYATRADSDYCFDIDARMCDADQNSCNVTEQNGCFCRSLPSGESRPSGCQGG